MPVSVITDVVTWIEMLAQIGLTNLELGVLNYLVFGGGWLDMIRLISFWLDVTIIKWVDKFYSYFGKILGGQIFSPTVVDDVMNRVYIFVALLVLIKLMMLFIKYLVNPELVNDDKVGAAALVKRVIVGMCIMLFLPSIFNLATDVQVAVLNDNLIGKLLLDRGQLRAYEKNKDQMGRVLAFNVYQSFWNLDTSRVTKSGIQKKYKQALEAKDPAVIGGLFAINKSYGDDYAYDYFPILSSVVLIYVLYLIIKYCLDVVVRMFKLFLLQMIGPLAISDYMINGDSKDVFKSWVKMTLSVYLMLFVRIFSIWFIAFITILMNKECTSAVDGVCSDSLLYIPVGSEPDYLLRGIITLGLLALLMDLPKFFSDLLGLDLEQDASVKGIMQKAGGALKTVGMGAMAAGGAAIGGAIGGMKGVASSAKNLAGNKMQNKGKFDAKVGKKDAGYAQRMSAIQNNSSLTNRQKAKAIKQERKQWMENNPGAQETKDYKRANKSANMQAASQISASAGGVARGGLQGLARAIPGLREGMSGYDQGQGAVNKQRDERTRTFAEAEQAQNGYRKGMEVAAGELKVMTELSGDTPQIKQPVELSGELKHIDNAYVPNSIGMSAEMDATRVGEQTVKTKIETDGNVDIGDISVAPIKTKIEASGDVDTSGLGVSPIKADVEVGTKDVKMDVDLKVNTSGLEKGISAFDHIDGNMDG